MLKVVFLLLGGLLMSPQGLSAHEENHVERVNTEEGMRMVVSVGEETHKYGDTHHSFHPSGRLQELDGFIVLDGHVTFNDGVNRHQYGYVIYFDASGNELKKEIYDSKEGSSVEGVFALHDGHMIAVSKADGEEQSDYYETRLFMKQGAGLVHEETLPFVVRQFEQRESFVRLRGDDTSSQSERVITSVHSGIKDEDGIYGFKDDQSLPFTLYILGEGMLNDQKETGLVDIDYPGHYRFDNGKVTDTFTLHADIQGVSEGAIYTEPFTVTVDEGHTFLNHSLYVNEQMIDEIGHHTLRVEGVGNYEKTVDFTLKSNLNGIQDGGHYQSERTLTFNGEGYLDNHRINSGITIDECGEYHLTIEGANGYSETYAFTVAMESMQEASLFTMERSIALGSVSMLAIGLVVYKIRK